MLRRLADRGVSVVRGTQLEVEKEALAGRVADVQAQLDRADEARSVLSSCTRARARARARARLRRLTACPGRRRARGHSTAA